MKHTVLTGILCLTIGIAIGWIAKPGHDVVNESPDPPLAKGSPAAKPTPSTRSGDSTGLASKSIRPAENDDEKKKKNPSFTMSAPNPAMQKRFQKMIIDQAKQRSSNKVAELAEKLGLTAEQTARLQACFDARIAGLTGNRDAADGMPDMLALAKLQSNQSIDTALADILTDDQSAAYEELKTNERNRKVESRAYKHLETKNSGMFQNMIFEGEGGADSPTAVFSIETSVSE